MSLSLLSVAPGVAISSYAKYCHRKLTKAALTGAKKVSSFVCLHVVVSVQVKQQSSLSLFHKS